MFTKTNSQHNANPKQAQYSNCTQSFSQSYLFHFIFILFFIIKKIVCQIIQFFSSLSKKRILTWHFLLQTFDGTTWSTFKTHYVCYGDRCSHLFYILISSDISNTNFSLNSSTIFFTASIIFRRGIFFPVCYNCNQYFIIIGFG